MSTPCAHKRISGALLAVCLSAAAPLAAGAREPAANTTVGIDYLAPASCPRAEDFIALVKKRANADWQFGQGAGHLQFYVEIRDSQGVRTGRVQRASGRDISEPREVTGTDCSDVVAALAFATALSLEEQPPSAALSVAAGATTASATADSRALWVVGVGASATNVVRVAALAGAAFTVENRAASGPGGLSWHRPDLRLTLSHARNDVVGGPGAARFSLSMAALDLCPVTAHLGAGSHARLCATGDVGVLAGQGLSIDHPAASRSLWAAAGGRAGLRWTLGPRWELDLQAGAVAPLRRTTFVFESPHLLVTAVPPVVWNAALLVGLVIP